LNQVVDAGAFISSFLGRKSSRTGNALLAKRDS
jgi:hypothetical protein